MSSTKPPYSRYPNGVDVNMRPSWIRRTKVFRLVSSCKPRIVYLALIALFTLSYQTWINFSTEFVVTEVEGTGDLQEVTYYARQFIEEPKVDYSGTFHVYQEHVDLRIIVITYDRAKSLQRVLDHLQGLQLDGDRAFLEIWLDVDKEGKPNPDVLDVARKFRWDQGPTRLHIHSRNIGLYGQWINTWRPQDKPSHANKTELALFVEDDVDLSVYSYRWLRACYEFYHTRTDIGVFGLQDENAKISKGKMSNTEVEPGNDTLLFLYRVPGSWGISPHPVWWRRFQDWFVTVSKNPKFKPYVPGAAMHTSWYKVFEKQKRQHHMWTMWFIKYTSDQGLFMTFSNLPRYTNLTNVSFVSNRKEDGLHFNPNMRSHWQVPTLMTEWNDSYINFPKSPAKYDYNGKEIHDDSDIGR